MMRALILGGVAAVLTAAAAALFYVAYFYVESEAIIQRRFPLPSTLPHPLQTDADIAQGRHLVTVLGCADCHGAALKGRMIEHDPAFRMYAPGLRNLKAVSDKEIARSIRFGLKPNGTSVWMMPSSSYLFMKEADVDSVIAYLRSLPQKEAPFPQPRFTFAARREIARGHVLPEAFSVEDLPNSIDLGPRYEGGRYLARAACSQCHGLDLGGSAGAPGLKIVRDYTLPEFFVLLRNGGARAGKRSPEMRRLTKTRFHDLADYEVIALYRYLYVRSLALEVVRTPS